MDAVAVLRDYGTQKVHIFDLLYNKALFCQLICENLIIEDGRHSRDKYLLGDNEEFTKDNTRPKD